MPNNDDTTSGGYQGAIRDNLSPGSGAGGFLGGTDSQKADAEQAVKNAEGKTPSGIGSANPLSGVAFYLNLFGLFILATVLLILGFVALNSKTIVNATVGGKAKAISSVVKAVK